MKKENKRRSNLSPRRIITLILGVGVLAQAALTGGTAKDALSEFEVQDGVKPPSSNLPAYDPKKCNDMFNGHCRDEDGGAWSYRNNDGDCLYKEGSAPTDGGVRDNFPIILSDVKSVLDFGGGVGSYMTGFRDKGVAPLVIVEPQPLGNCLWNGLTQDLTDWINSPLDKLPKNQYDLVMTVEVVEHIPVGYHEHLIQALAQATKKWLYFSAAHPKQAGEGHVGPSMKWRTQWIEEVQNWTTLRVDQETSELIYAKSGRLLRTNSVLFRKP
jgi:hypothetical protein